MYGTLEGWRAYALARGDSAPTDATDADANAALTRASDYIQYRYVANLCPPYDDTLPVVVDATYVAASIELATPGFFSKTYTPSEHKVLTEVKGIKWQVTGDKGTWAAYPTSTIIDAMFKPYVCDLDAAGIGLWSIGGGACV